MRDIEEGYKIRREGRVDKLKTAERMWQSVVNTGDQQMKTNGGLACVEPLHTVCLLEVE